MKVLAELGNPTMNELGKTRYIKILLELDVHLGELHSNIIIFIAKSTACCADFGLRRDLFELAQSRRHLKELIKR